MTQPTNHRAQPTKAAAQSGPGPTARRPRSATRPTSATRPFSPRREAPQELSDRTVGRDRLLNSLNSKLLSAATSKARPHVLLVGPQGSGKSHVIEVALHRAAREPAFAQGVVVVRVPEDAVGITRYPDLLAEAIRVLEPRGARQSLAAGQADREERVAALLGDRVLLLVIENLDRVFTDFKLAGQRALRAWVETSGQVLLLASTPLLFPEVQDREQPWFGGFATFLLPDLSPDDARQLLTRSAAARGDTELVTFLDSPAGIARVQALAQLTGGSPRIWMILAGLVNRESLDDLVAAVADLLEALVPYYRQLLWGLSANERRLVAALAAAGGAATVSQLAQAAELEQRVAATTLGRLAETKWVVAEKPRRSGDRPADRRGTYYRLRDPMLRHHMQYRDGPAEPLELIVMLLRDFYDRSGQLNRILAAESGSMTERNFAAAKGDPSSAGDPWTMPPPARHHAVRSWIGTGAADLYSSRMILDAVAAANAGGTPPTIPTDSAIGVLVARILAAASGEEAARLSLPPELLPLLDDIPPADPTTST